MNYYKILNSNELHYKMKYHTGLNINCEEFNPTGDCADGGMYFSREDILAFLDYGPWIRQVTLCPDSKVYENPGQPVKWKTNRFILGERRKITAKVIKELIQEGVNIHADNDFALRWSSEEGHLTIVKLLIENGADIHANYDGALRWSSYNNHLKIVKLLVKNGSSINNTGNGGTSLQLAAEANNLEIVKYLIENGANVHADRDAAFNRAVKGNCLEIVKYLLKKEINANILKKSIVVATDYGNYKILKYLEKELKISFNKMDDKNE